MLLHHRCHRPPPFTPSIDTWCLALHHLSSPRPEWLNSCCGRLPLPGLNLTRTTPLWQRPRIGDSRGAWRCPQPMGGQRRHQVGTKQRPGLCGRQPTAQTRDRFWSTGAGRRPGWRRVNFWASGSEESFQLGWGGGCVRG